MTERKVLHINPIGARAERPKPMSDRAPVEPKPHHLRRPRELGRRRPALKGEVPEERRGVVA